MAKIMPHEKYKPFLPFFGTAEGDVNGGLKTRTWPSNFTTKAPRWCSVDLRDGNQALIDPMDLERKKRMFDLLVRLGFKEIEVGFPAASETDYNFVRLLIEQNLIPQDVTIQVLVQCREDLIETTYNALLGVDRAIVHFYNSTSVLQRKVVFKSDKQGIVDLAVKAARLVREHESRLKNSQVSYEYSPESFTGTEPSFVLEIVKEVFEALQLNDQESLIVNVPATVEMYTPNLYGDVVEYIDRNLSYRDQIVLSVHPHNDRGTAVAAGEMAMLAGAQRIEGTLFGNGERTGNVDLVTLGLNLLVQGVDPQLDLSDLDAVKRDVEYCNRLKVHERHPYVGDLVYTAFSGSHQDAIKKGMAALREGESESYKSWEVPYLLIDPAHVGKTYQSVIRINSQSGKGGVAYVMNNEFGLDLPRRLQIEFSQAVQHVTEQTGGEITAGELFDLFEQTYLDEHGGYQLRSSEVSSRENLTNLTGQLLVDEQAVTVTGSGGGPLSALVDGLKNDLGVTLEITDYQEHAVGAGTDATAAAYVEAKFDNGNICWGVGLDESVLTASLKAVVSAVRNNSQTTNRT